MAELYIVGLVAVVLAMGYLSIYPKIAGNNVNKISLCDIACSMFVFALVASKFWGTGYVFNAILFSTNWFWFTLFIYVLIEIPLAIWYVKKHGVQFDSKL
ncbi:hypothetical protein [Shewanella pneumatophori]|uniref:Uncharacterized protein n=1 Tax=Shewanella pneumatophori TaxID=314092 RepID=A0A9X1ZPT5_9GAMM|nr:hypothetical protein [Shewanella pneumatophori]